MKTIILCGGIGYRLKEETEFKPKPMVFIGNQPVLWHIMKIYASYGYNEFILALGYKADYIKDYFLNQKAFTSDFTLETRHHKTKFYLDDRQEIDNFKITFVDTGLETLPGERILRCEKYIPERDKYFMVTYGDGVCDVDIDSLIKFHKRAFEYIRIGETEHPMLKRLSKLRQLSLYKHKGFWFAIDTHKEFEELN